MIVAKIIVTYETSKCLLATFKYRYSSYIIILVIMRKD